MELKLIRKDSVKPTPERKFKVTLTKVDKRKSDLIDLVLPKLKQLAEYPTEHLVSVGIKYNGKDYKVIYARDVTETSTECNCTCDFDTVVSQAKKNRCSGIVIAHNHPDECILVPSKEDDMFTESLKGYCEDEGLTLYDSVIVVKGKGELPDYLSFYEYRRIG